MENLREFHLKRTTLLETTQTTFSRNGGGQAFDPDRHYEEGTTTVG